VELTGDLDQAVVEEALRGRPVRCYPALLSSEAEATAWARAGAPAGALVTAGYQVSPRGRAGVPWEVELDRGLVFSLVLRPGLSAEREGWPYITVSVALSDVLGGREATALQWPDRVEAPDATAWGALGLTTQLGPSVTEWVVATMLVADAVPPRAPLLAAVVQAVERRTAQKVTQVVADYRARCATLGRHVRARMIPLGPAGPTVQGTAVDVLDDGALVLLTDRGNRVAVRPQNLGVLEQSEDSRSADRP
jgi:BirA family biotin operon repressor/biotin-[acetyl-CoA-carboxylase] ligase